MDLLFMYIVILIWSMLFAILSLFFTWEAWVSVGIVTISALVISITRAKFPRPQPNISDKELQRFVMAPAI